VMICLKDFFACLTYQFRKTKQMLVAVTLHSGVAQYDSYTLALTERYS